MGICVCQQSCDVPCGPLQFTCHIAKLVFVHFSLTFHRIVQVQQLQLLCCRGRNTLSISFPPQICSYLNSLMHSCPRYCIVQRRSTFMFLISSLFYSSPPTQFTFFFSISLSLSHSLPPHRISYFFFQQAEVSEGEMLQND